MCGWNAFFWNQRSGARARPENRFAKRVIVETGKGVRCQGPGTVKIVNCIRHERDGDCGEGFALTPEKRTSPAQRRGPAAPAGADRDQPERRSWAVHALH
jgi:hypothetical protein